MGRSQALAVLLCLSAMMGAVEAEELQNRQDTATPTTSSVLRPFDPLSTLPGSLPPLSQFSSTGTSSSATSSAPSIPTSLTFKTIANLSTCTSVSISWDYSGPPGILSVAVTNYQVPQTSQTNSQVDEYIGTNITLVSSGSLTWPSVNIPPGMYDVQGYTQGDTFYSNTFAVVSGSDVSCLPPTSSSAPQPTSTGSSDLSGTTSSTKLSSGDIAGIVVGSLGFACVVIFGFLLWRLFKRRRPTLRGASGYREKRAWGGLDSMDSHRNSSVGRADLAGSQVAQDLPNVAIVGTPSHRGKPSLDLSLHGKNYSPTQSDDDVTTLAPHTLDYDAPMTPYGAPKSATDGFSASNVDSPISPINYSRPARLSDPTAKANGGGKHNGVTNHNRRSSAMRKPVPAYRPGEGVEALELTVDPTRNRLGNTGRMSSSQTSVNLSTPSQPFPGENPFIGGLELPELNHKSSFGDRAMPVLMPDMPPPSN